MKKDEVKTGGIYKAKVTDKVVPVRLDAEHPSGGWEATNMITGKKIRVKSAQRLRGPASAPENAASAATTAPATDATSGIAGADTGQTGGRTRKRLTKAERDALKTQHKADQENARARDERDASADGMTASERAMAESEKDKSAAKPRKKREGMSCLDAAAQVLATAKEPLNTKAMIELMEQDGLWHSDAATPHATLYSAILREINTKGDEARFKKVERGRFAANA